MVSNALVQLLKYGNWSGPGWTAGRFESDFAELNVARILSTADRSVLGVDAYDHYVSKAHDLNEVDAERNLRQTLGDLGLISNDTTTIGSDVAFTERLVFGGEGEPERFVSLDHYMTLLDGSNATQQQRVTFAKAFVNYYSHIEKSNTQFSIDYLKNGVDLIRNFPSGIRMIVQLAGAAHIFLGEAADVSNLIQSKIIPEFGSGVVVSGDIETYLEENFLTPEGRDFDGFSDINGDSFTRTLSKDQIISFSRQELLDVYVLLRDAAMEGDAQFARVVQAIQDRDFKSLEEIKDVLANDEVFRRDLCFAAGTQIDMADGSRKPIERVRIGDWVLAYQGEAAMGRGALLPRKVTQTFATPGRLVLDFHGTKVTPGHVFLCGDGPYEGRYRMLLDILCDDGAVVARDGRRLRAATNFEVGGPEDAMIEVVCVGDGGTGVRARGTVRAGTRLIWSDGGESTLFEAIRANGFRILEDGRVVRPGEEPQPLYFGGDLPKPEDYVLRRSGLTLADLEAGVEHESIQTGQLRRAHAVPQGWTPAPAATSVPAIRRCELEPVQQVVAPRRGGETFH